MRTYLELKFGNANGETKRLMIPYPKEDLKDEMVKNACLAVVDNRVLKGKRGILDTVISARLVQTTYNEYNVL